MNPVVIVGGGLSGLAAAVYLSSRRIPVLLLEQRRFLGGRAYSFVDESTGTVIDNGQHVLIAGYTRTMEFLGTIGTRGRLAVQSAPELVFHHPERGFCSFRLPLLPSPLHLISGIITTDLFSAADKLRMLRAGAALRSFRREAVGGMTIDAWLDSLGQSAETKRSFWEPLAVAVMNERIGVASALVFIRALRTAFLSGRRERLGGVIRCGADVAGSVGDGENVAGVRLKEGETIPCSALILAVPSYRAPALLPAVLRETGYMAPAASIPLSPIVSVHLWFEKEVMPQEILGVIGRRIQWVFNRRKISHEKGHEQGRGGHLSAVISAAHAMVDMGNDELIRIVLEDLESIYGANAGHTTRALVIREKRGTFSCTPEVEQIRPGCGTPVPNLFIAGDWTDTGYPATIEGAIMSGERSAGRVAALVEGRK